MNRFIRRPAAVRRRQFIWSKKWFGVAMKSTFFARKSPNPMPSRRNSASICISSPPGQWAVTPGCGISNTCFILPFWSAWWSEAARTIKFDLLFSQHAISAVAAGRLKRRLNVPVVMNFPDLLTGFMETWPAYVAPRPFVEMLKRYEISMPVRYGVDGVLAISDTLADYFVERDYPREKILPIYYGYAAEYFPFYVRMIAPNRPPVVVMHGSLDFHHLGDIAFGAIRHVTQKCPGTVFRFVGQRTAVLEKFLARTRVEIPGFKFECTGFVPYDEVARYLADASVGIVPYEESAGTHCAFVAKVVEYVACGLPAVCTPIQSIRRYFQNDPMVRFAEFDGADFGKKIISWLDGPPLTWQIQAGKSAARVQAELDWQPLCRRAVDFVEGIYARSQS